MADILRFTASAMAVASILYAGYIFYKQWERTATDGDLNLTTRYDQNVPPLAVIQYGFPILSYIGQIRRLLYPPATTVLEDSFGSLRFNILAAIVKLEIPDHLVGKRLLPAELSAVTGVKDVQRLLRLLRAAKTMGYFHEGDDGRWRNTALSSVLAKNHAVPYPNNVKTYAEDHYPTWGYIYESLLLPSTDDQDLFFPKLHDGKSVWQFFQENPERQKQFGAAMAELDTFAHFGVVQDYDWSQYRRVVDLGGNEGSMLHAILKHYPSLTGVVFDLPSVVEKNSKAAWAGRFADLAHRVELLGGDLFDASSIPAGRDGDAFLMRNILHDWNDAEAIAILKNVRKAMGYAGATLTLAEASLRDGKEWWQRLMTDVNMMLMYNGMERTASQWRAVFAAAGFQFEDMVELRSGLRLIVGKPV